MSHVGHFSLPTQRPTKLSELVALGKIKVLASERCLVLFNSAPGGINSSPVILEGFVFKVRGSALLGMIAQITYSLLVGMNHTMTIPLSTFESFANVLLKSHSILI